ncbi:MAG: Glu/Leu/Phe/Val dehydrogenase [Acidimicrobiia bacterium]|nr:Glu/Leu/Phe/Val dehydrogenase [Acidimicrobiia bacterium]
MNTFGRIEAGDHEQVVYCHDRTTGLRAIIAIHSTALGPSLGGTRFYPYPSEDAALSDVLALAEAMSYKAAVAGLDQGGGKAVIIGDPATDRTDELMLAHGRFIDALAGRYVTAEDVGTTQVDMDLISQVTRYVTGTTEGRGGSGDPSAATAAGLASAMRALLFLSSGADDLRGSHVVVAGVGKVGSYLVGHLVEEGARITIADVKDQAVERVRAAYDVDVAPAADAHRVPCDIYAPCGLGGVLNTATIPELRCWAVAGAANNQLASPECGQLLADAGILYAPDFVVNAGGIINIAEERSRGGYDHERAFAKVLRVYDTTLAVFDAAKRDGLTPVDAALALARKRLDAGVHQIRTFK